MKKTNLRLSALILAAVMCVGFFASCGNNKEQESGSTSEGSQSQSTETVTSAETSIDTSCEDSDSSSTEITVQTDSHTTETGNTETSDISSDSEVGDESSSETEEETKAETEEETYPEAEGENGLLIQNANNSINNVNAYFADILHKEFVLENTQMSFAYNISDINDMQFSYIKNSNGNAYIESTMDVFVRMKSGETFYTSKSQYPANANLYRLGYYYYEARFEEQIFSGEGKVTAEKKFKPKFSNFKHVEEPKIDSDGAIVTKIVNSTDPYIVIDKAEFSTDEYKYLEFSAKVDYPSATVYLIAGGSEDFSDIQSKTITLIADGEYHTYRIPLASIHNYSGDVTGLRIDFNSHAVGGNVAIKDIRAIAIDGNNCPDSLSMSRSFMVYNDKMHQFIQIATTKEANDIDVFGFLTEIDANTVNGILIKDKDGIKSTLEGVDWESVEYVGFDIADAGIFGYILPYDNASGNISVTLNDSIYRIEQTLAPENGTVIPSQKDTLNANDFFMGQRIYTDENHDFDAFIYEAECERHPLTEENIIIETESSNTSYFTGYNALRGYYGIFLEGDGSFTLPFSSYPQKKYNVKFSITDVDKERKLYIATYNGGGCLECAVILDKNDMLLPVPVEVGKNFSEASGDRNLFNLDDSPYSEALFPITVKPDKTEILNVVHLYQMWGQHPIKQLSWIQYTAPYYHISTGVTETNCIIPFGYIKIYRSFTYLPDFRAMSAPLWQNQPQHNRGGDHAFMLYTDAEGNFNGIENLKNTIRSYGPTYAEVEMVFISDDGNIKLTVNHMEMPQTDENRAYYQMKYEILGDVSFADFAHDFSFYTVASGDPTGLYQKVGYLDENNICTVADAVKDDSTKEYVLGDIYPYFDFFMMDNYTSTAMEGYTNVSMIISDASFKIGGEDADPSFLLINTQNTLRLSLNIGKTELKAGDEFTVNAILLPWGSQASEYPEEAPDKNVRDVRKNTLINRVKLEVGKSTEVVESAHLPTVKTTNGSVAEFTISGGTNNQTVRVDGFERLTVPVIEEKTQDGWTTYYVNSVNCPDAFGNRHQYDGYGVSYEKDGTYSYSFVVDMTNSESRTFRIRAITPFAGWEELPDISVSGPYNNYSDANDLSSCATSPKPATVEIMDDGAYIRYTTAGPDYYILTPAGPNATGQYAVMKYRINQPKTDSNQLTSMEIFTSTQNSVPQGGDNTELYGCLRNDGEWHLLIIDLSKLNIHTFTEKNGEYFAKYLRLDIVNFSVSDTTAFDIAFVALGDDLEEIIENNKEEFPIIDICTSKNDTVRIDSATGEEYVEPKDDGVPEHYTGYITPEKLLDGTNIRFNSVTLSEEKDYVSYKTNQYDASLTNNFSGVTGQYVVMKYRVVKDPSEQFDFHVVEMFASTNNAIPTAGDNIEAYNCIVADGEWQLLIIDTAAWGNNSVVASEGKYSLKYFRLDTVNSTPTNANTSFDIAFIATGDDLNTILAGNADEFENATLCQGRDQSTNISTKATE